MKMISPVIRITLIGFVLAIWIIILEPIWITYKNFIVSDVKLNSIHIAIVGPIKGSDAALGRSGVQGINILLDRVNKEGGINGRKVILDIYDDENKKEIAEKKATEIAEQSLAVAVIGHTKSSNSVAAGKIYKKIGIPAITPGSSNVEVTSGNEWYFRNIFNDNAHGRYLANYAKRILNHNTVSIIRENASYGSYLAKIFEQTSRELGSNVQYIWEFKTGWKYTDRAIKSIINELKTKNDAGLIFMATQAEDGISLVRQMRDAGIRNQILAPQTYSSSQFKDGTSKLPNGVSNQGYYSDGIYVTTPLIFDTANQEAQLFKADYIKAFKEYPDWRAAFSYDSAKLILEAIRNTGVTGTKKGLKQERKRIRDWLAVTNDIKDAIKGATGLNYFDENRDCPKTFHIGMYKAGDIISAPIQLHPAELAQDIPSQRNSENDEIFIDGKHMYKTAVVYTGIKINKINKIDIKSLKCDLDLNLWFKYRTGENPCEIDFLNADETINLGKPVVHQENDGITYEVYNIKNRFKIDFMPSRHVFYEHIAGVSFKHKKSDRSRIIYVTDVIGMGLTNETQIQTGNIPVNSADSSWSIKDFFIFQDTISVNTLGNPRYTDRKQYSIDYSRFNAVVRISKNELSIRGIIFYFAEMIPQEILEYLMLIGIIVLLLLLIIRISRKNNLFPKLHWLVTSMTYLFLIVVTEIRLIGFLSTKLSSYDLELTATFFDILWWLIPAFLLIKALDSFVWLPLEKQTKRIVPRLVRNMVVSVIFLVAIFGIVAFVFQQKLTGLLATSGLMAMIIGLAIQINISNIFSGIVLNLERPFRIGDWIKIGETQEGVITDITWRTTRIKTRSGVTLGLPNSIAAESRFENYSYPNNLISELITVYTDPFYSNIYVEKILNDATISVGENICGIVTRLMGVEEWSARYVLSFDISDYGARYRIRNAVWSRIMLHMRYAGIVPAIKDRQRHLFADVTNFSNGVKTPIDILNDIQDFKILPQDLKNNLSDRMRLIYVKKTVEHIGSPLRGNIELSENSLFLIREGVVSISVLNKSDSLVEIVRLNVGKFFGENSIRAQSAIVQALTDVELFEIPGANIEPLINIEDDFQNYLTQGSMNK